MFFILDRDGVINYESDLYIKSPDEWIPLPGSLLAIAQLKNAGYQVVIATNQSGVGRGLFSLQTLHDIHQKMIQELAKLQVTVDGIFYCPHHPEANCQCRKPQPELLYKLAKQFNINLADCTYVGDSFGDIQLAKKVGCKPILVLTGKGQQTLNENKLEDDVDIYPDLATAVSEILKLKQE
jgi:D-glycero-D-manno-heptose 1,7-bisphosphate phosphatase